jgi:hypothetical protein
MLNVNNLSTTKSEEVATTYQPNDFACMKQELQQAEIHEEPIRKKMKQKKSVSIAESQ